MTSPTPSAWAADESPAMAIVSGIRARTSWKPTAREWLNPSPYRNRRKDSTASRRRPNRRSVFRASEPSSSSPVMRDVSGTRVAVLTVGLLSGASGLRWGPVPSGTDRSIGSRSWSRADPGPSTRSSGSGPFSTTRAARSRQSPALTTRPGDIAGMVHPPVEAGVGDEHRGDQAQRREDVPQPRPPHGADQDRREGQVEGERGAGVPRRERGCRRRRVQPMHVRAVAGHERSRRARR